MDKRFKEIIKEAILEALAEFTGAGVATMSLGNVVPGGTEVGSGDDSDSGKDDNDSGNNNSGNNSGQGGGSANNSGGTPSEDGRPKPNVGVGVWSRR